MHLITDRHLSCYTTNQAGCALRFLFRVTLRQPDICIQIPLRLTPSKLPELLSRQEVESILNACSSLRHRIILTTIYASGLRVSELCRLQISDNDHPGKNKRVQLPAETFIQRFLQHVLPPGFKRIRHYGILASCHKREKLAQCRLALHMPEPQAVIIESVQAFMLRVQQLDLTRCTKCATGVMQVISAIAPKRLLLQPTTGPPP